MRQRICISCKRKADQSKLIRLTVDTARQKVCLKQKNNKFLQGRSAYICPNFTCLEKALKGTRLKIAFLGRRLSKKQEKSCLIWPLEAQIIKDMEKLCTEVAKTCQNTQSKESNA